MPAHRAAERDEDAGQKLFQRSERNLGGGLKHLPVRYEITPAAGR